MPASTGSGRTEELLDWVVSSILDIAVTLQTAADLGPGAAGPHLAEALRRLAETVQAVRDHAFAEQARSDLADWSASGDQAHSPGA